MRRTLPSRSPTTGLSCSRATAADDGDDMGEDTMGGRTGGDGTVAPQAGAAAVTLSTVGSMADIDAAAWDRLVQAAPTPSPFLRHAFLAAMESSACTTAGTGWQPMHL